MLIQYPRDIVIYYIVIVLSLKKWPIQNRPLLSHKWKACMFMPGRNDVLWNKCDSGFVQEIRELSLCSVSHRAKE